MARTSPERRWVEHLNGRSGIVARIRSTRQSELPYRRRHQLLEGLEHVQHVPFDSDAAIAAASIRFELEKRGSTIGPLDMLIAGTAVSRGAALVTNNAAEFSRVPGLRVLDCTSS